MNLPIGIDYRTSQINNKEYIYLRRIPPLISDALKIAHEIQHVVHRSENIPSIGTPYIQYNNLTSCINSCLHDILVNRDLLLYKFDLCEDFIKEVNDDKKQLVNIHNEPTDYLATLHFAFNYYSKKLDFEFITKEYEYDDISFFDWFENRYPNITELAKRIENIIPSIDNIKKENIGILLQQIINEFNLQNLMNI